MGFSSRNFVLENLACAVTGLFASEHVCQNPRRKRDAMGITEWFNFVICLRNPE
jgi:hypothetical protein